MDRILYHSIGIVLAVTQTTVQFSSVDGQTFLLKRNLFTEDVKVNNLVEYTFVERPTGEKVHRVNVLH